jgi:hypothetical protein
MERVRTTINREGDSVCKEEHRLVKKRYIN